jgi:K+-sensing histidine kinase KdpD
LAASSPCGCQWADFQDTHVKRQFLASVSHELRTPLTNIKSSIWLLEHGKPEKRDYYTAVLSQETDSLHALVEDVLTLTALDLGKLQPDLRPLELGELITKATADRESLLASRRLTLQMRCAADLPRVNADASLLMLLLSNLIALTVDRSMHGSAIALDCVRRTAAGEPAGEQPAALADSAADLAQPAAAAEGVAIVVATGPHAATSAAAAGLRMAICEEIVKRHRGQITEARNDQESHSVTVWLPAAGASRILTE